VHHHKNRLHVCEGVGSGVGADVVGEIVAGADVSGADVDAGADVEVPGVLPAVADCSSFDFFLSLSDLSPEADAETEADAEAPGEPVAEVPPVPAVSPSG
jgi:hypothetical protein